MIITVACDSKGAAAAESWLRAASPQHPSLIDTQHIVPELYSTRNVPAGFWIDESGRIVRANDPIYAQRRSRDTNEVTINERYLNALRDWVEKGAESIYVQDEGRMQERMYPMTEADAQAMAHFRLGVYLHQQGDAAAAVAQFKLAQAMQPVNWNYKRQAWNLGDIERDYGTTFQQAMQDPANQPFYPPLDLPEPTEPDARTR